MRVSVESWSVKYSRLRPSVKKTALKLGRFLRIGNAKLDVILVDDSFMSKNVLSFPAPTRFPGLDNGGKFLGEVYLNPGYIKKEGERLEYMLTHGLLHILGYDHHKKSDIIRMEKMEQKLLQKLGDSTA